MKKWSDILGIPEGDELVWANEIIKKSGQFKFKTLWKFDDHTLAERCFNEWLEENKGENNESN